MEFLGNRGNQLCDKKKSTKINHMQQAQAKQGFYYSIIATNVIPAV